jgi:triphosphatase
MTSIIQPPPLRPELPPGLNVGEAFVRILEHQGTRMLAQAALIIPDGEDPEPVHQTRVALRRMRSALSVFRAASASEATSDLASSLRALGHLLGPARAWDVFLHEAGARIGTAFADHREIRRLLRASEKRRQAAYAALAQDLAGPHFSQLTRQFENVVNSRGWIAATDVDQRAVLHQPLDQFGAHILARLHKRVRRAGAHLRHLDTAALHALRLRGKRLRYAAEFFGEQFPGKPTARYLRRLAALQDELGWLNDAATTAALMTELGARGQASGIVLGYVAAEAATARARLPGIWKRFRRADPFWTGPAAMAATSDAIGT